MAKENPADVEAAELLALQTSVGTDTTRYSAHFALTVGLFLFIFLFGVLVWVLPQKNFSENENRLLAELPAFSIDEIMNGKLTIRISDFYSDHFPLRDGFVSISSYTEILLGRREANGVVASSTGGKLAERRNETASHRLNLEKSLNAILEITDNIGISSTVAVIPDALTAQSEIFGLVVNDHRDQIGNDIIYLDQNDASFYYNTDHHCTTEGAYAIYRSLYSQLDYSPLPDTDFSKEIVSNSFYGTAWSRSGLYLTPPDKLEIWRYSDDNNYSITGDLTLNGFYDFSKLEKKDKYAVFLGGNHGHIEITNGEDKPRLLIIKDSFANSVIPFLARHFDLTVIDPRYFYGDLIEIAAECDKILFLYGINSLISDRDLVRLTLER